MSAFVPRALSSKAAVPLVLGRVMASRGVAIRAKRPVADSWRSAANAAATSDPPGAYRDKVPCPKFAS